MSSGNVDWTWLFQFCVQNRPEKAAERKVWKFCPSSTGEPWISYAIASELLQMGAEAVRKKAAKLPTAFKHPSVAGLFKLTGLELVASDDGEET